MEQKNNITSAPAFTGPDLIKLLLKNIKSTVLISLIVALVFGAMTVVLGLSSTTYAGTIDFYLVNTDETESLLPLLQSDAFAERLLLDKYGLPEELAGTPEYENAKEKVQAFDKAREQLAKTTRDLNKINMSLTTPKDANGNVISSFAIISQEYAELQSDYSRLYSLLATYKNAQTEGTVTEAHRQETQKLEASLQQARKALEAYKQSAYMPAQREIAEITDKHALELQIVAQLREEADEAVETVVATWRADPDVASNVSAITDAMTFVYATPDESVSDVLTDQSSGKEDTQNISFLKVSVQTRGDKELADFIIERLKLRLPEYAEKNVERLAEVPVATCTLISPFSEAVSNDLSGIIKNAVSTAAITAIVAFVVLCAIVVAKEWWRLINASQSSEDNNTTSNS